MPPQCPHYTAATHFRKNNALLSSTYVEVWYLLLLLHCTLQGSNWATNDATVLHTMHACAWCLGAIMEGGRHMGLTGRQTAGVPNACLQLRLAQYLATPHTSEIGSVMVFRSAHTSP